MRLHAGRICHINHISHILLPQISRWKLDNLIFCVSRYVGLSKILEVILIIWIEISSCLGVWKWKSFLWHMYSLTSQQVLINSANKCFLSCKRLITWRLNNRTKNVSCSRVGMLLTSSAHTMAIQNVYARRNVYIWTPY